MLLKKVNTTIVCDSFCQIKVPNIGIIHNATLRNIAQYCVQRIYKDNAKATINLN